jgi:Spy/CpxP family protein refolding chaperone
MTGLGAKVALGVFLATVVASPDLHAGEPSQHKWWRWDVCRAEIGLTDEQSAEVERIFQSVLPDLRREKAELDRQESLLSQLLVEEIDEARVHQAIERVERARSALGRTRAAMLYRMYRVLSPPQRKKLQAFWERLEHQRRDRDSQPRR